MKPFPIEGITALVTGANRGIGQSLVAALLERGAKKVYAGARRPGDLEPVRALDPARVVPLRLDVTNSADRFNLTQHATDTSLLINNAGVLDIGRALDVSAAAVARNFDVNCFGPLNVTRTLAPALAANRGAVVNVLTLVALASMPALGAYSASKAAAWSITQSLRSDLRAQGVSVFGVFPGAVDTDMIRAFDMPKAAPAAVASAILDGIERGTEDIFPDAMSEALYAQWRNDHKSLERQLAVM
jgi:NAD(P)-dependent dehydrogenase (short-subunit alcohol dehydrogenase family)